MLEFFFKKLTFVFSPWIQTLNSSKEKNWAEQLPSLYIIIHLLPATCQIKRGEWFPPCEHLQWSNSSQVLKRGALSSAFDHRRKEKMGLISFLSLRVVHPWNTAQGVSVSWGLRRTDRQLGQYSAGRRWEGLKFRLVSNAEDKGGPLTNLQASFRCLVTADGVGELWSTGSRWAGAVVKLGKQLFDSHCFQISH